MKIPYLLTIILGLVGSCTSIILPLNEQSILDQVNDYRRIHCSPPVSFNPAISISAQTWSDYLAKENKFEHSDSSRYGENLGFFSFSALNTINLTHYYTRSVSLWYDEVDFYDFNTPRFSPSTGHFTQLVWKATTEIGIGISYSESNNNILVCMQYYVRGNENSVAEFQKNVLTGNYKSPILENCNLPSSPQHSPSPSPRPQHSPSPRPQQSPSPSPLPPIKTPKKVKKVKKSTTHHNEIDQSPQHSPQKSPSPYPRPQQSPSPRPQPRPPMSQSPSPIQINEYIKVTTRYPFSQIPSPDEIALTYVNDTLCPAYINLLNRENMIQNTCKVQLVSSTAVYYGSWVYGISYNRFREMLQSSYFTTEANLPCGSTVAVYNVSTNDSFRYAANRETCLTV
jgi:hypothetical protein